MNEIWVFLTGVGLTLGLTLGVVIYMRPHLRGILVDLCGTEPRAEFWAAFSSVTLVLVPLAAAMLHRPDTGQPVFFEVSAQLRLALFGLIAAVVGLGIVVGRFIPTEAALKRFVRLRRPAEA